jgi:hypothetical protein
VRRRDVNNRVDSGRPRGADVTQSALQTERGRAHRAHRWARGGVDVVAAAGFYVAISGSKGGGCGTSGAQEA